MVGAISFLLHCAFILIVTTVSGLTIIFTFFGLLITEILPSMFILGVFWRPIYKLFFSTETPSALSSATVEMKTQNEDN